MFYKFACFYAKQSQLSDQSYRYIWREVRRCGRDQKNYTLYKRHGELDGKLEETCRQGKKRGQVRPGNILLQNGRILHGQ